MADDKTPEITLTLLHPTQGTTLQKWSLVGESEIRIGRAPENHVVIVSERVSRRHAELRRGPAGWDLVGLGSNGTFLDGEAVTRAPILDGQIFVLASSGPMVRFETGAAPAGLEGFGATVVPTAVPNLAIEINQSQRERQVSEIAESGYFQELQKKAADLRKGNES